MKLNVDKLLGKNQQTESGIDPAEAVLQEAKLLRQTMKQKRIGPIVKEDVENWEDEGGAFSSLPEEIEEMEKAQRFVALTMTTGEILLEHPLYEKYNKLLKELKELRDKKGKDYGTLEDPFANIRGAEEFGVKPWIGAANSANDCMVRIKQYAKTGRLENESVRDSMLDLANYSLISLILWEEDESDEVV